MHADMLTPPKVGACMTVHALFASLDFAMAFRFAVFCLFCASTMVPALAATAMHCHVSDPTGTPLNVRAVPNGTIVSTLSNGAVVAVLSQTTQNRRTWAY